MDKARAYHTGQASIWFPGMDLPEVPEELKEWFAAGQRDARAEERLNADTEWD